MVVALIHAFVTSSCSSVLVGLPLALTARLDQVLRCAAHLIGCIPKYASVLTFYSFLLSMRDTLHWPPIAQRIAYWIAVLVWPCLLGSTPAYLCKLCRLVSGLPGWRTLHSSVTGQLLVPRAITATMQCHTFSIVGPSTWNGLPLEIHLLPKNNENAFCRLLKTDLYCRGWAGGTSE